MKYWLMKSEPDVYSIDTLQKDKTTWWEGVRNYQARNFMSKEMSVGDLVLFYHSNAEPSGVAGIAKVSKAAAADKTQFDKKSDYFDAKATKEKPIWFCVEVEFVAKLKNFISLTDLRENEKLAEMVVLQKGSRLSVQPVDKKHFEIVKKMGGL
ncbi:MAG: EVE domain-containing protein [Bdellovibrio sp. ArHS]|uniref:EVE domain-containing protein n=1 Tax=Bdellovibrio sp. ArHS TaxID=1569284 RepID=UPI000583DF5D|nr:EVE domain-containing protein [Bdellovibrio sp. ArHS]KHD89291.1 MAG: EVE domain-containing protein [Bdellovibrio sp. ArHS]